MSQQVTGITAGYGELLNLLPPTSRQARRPDVNRHPSGALPPLLPARENSLNPPKGAAGKPREDLAGSVKGRSPAARGPSGRGQGAATPARQHRPPRLSRLSRI